MNPKHGTNCRPNSYTVPRKSRATLLPCGIPNGQMPFCLEPNCYLNYKCSVYRGIQINPPREYIPANIGNPLATNGILISDDSDIDTWFSNIFKR